MGGLTNELTSFIKFAKAIDDRNSCNGQHSEQVAKLMVCFAERLALSREEINLAYLSGMMHDIGKIGVPEIILNKPAQLTKSEFAVIKRHPDVGADLLSGISGFEKIADAVRYHHERYDGKGYPYGLQGQRIPFMSRMLALCDSYAAMTTIRCYREPFTSDRALGEIAQLSGTQFDPEISREFTSIVVDSQGV
ncbi:MAG: metal dependent phosphohydrolase [Anaerosporomusa subterranea]|nr:metal dependent phosphohydrolase [Anaerosporomusa subterranea]